jgi:hypothetical protein
VLVVPSVLFHLKLVRILQDNQGCGDSKKKSAFIRKVTPGPLPLSSSLKRDLQLHNDAGDQFSSLLLCLLRTTTTSSFKPTQSYTIWVAEDHVIRQEMQGVFPLSS